MELIEKKQKIDVVVRILFTEYKCRNSFLLMFLEYKNKVVQRKNTNIKIGNSGKKTKEGAEFK